MRKSGAAGLLVISACGVLFAQQDGPYPDLQYSVNPRDSRVEFAVHSSLTRVEGVFPKWQAEFKDHCLRLRVWNASATTGNEAKDKIVRGQRYLWAQKYRSSDFVCRRITADPADPFKLGIEGDFTMRGITKPATLQLTVDPSNTQRGRVRGDLSFERRDFGMPRRMPFSQVSDSVRVRLDLAVQAAPR